LAGGSSSLRAQLESVHRQTGVRPKELDDLVSLPECMGYVWKYFLDLNSKRGGGFGPAPISYQEMLSYFTLHNIEFNSYEISMIDALDREFLEHQAEQAKKESKKKTK